MSITINVTVFRGTAKLKVAPDKPVRKTPDGSAGVVYGGLVYPLRKKNEINLDDTTYSKNECREFYEDNEAIVYFEPRNASLKWSTEFNFKAKYIVFDGNPQTANSLFEYLEGQKLAIRLGESFRPASDGYHYDWFIRLNSNCTETVVNKAMIAFDASSELEDIDQSNEIEAAKNIALIVTLNNQITELQQDLQSSKNLIDQLNSKLSEEKRLVESKGNELNAAIIARDSYKDRAEKAALKVRKYVTRGTSLKNDRASENNVLAKKVSENESYLNELAADNEKLELENQELKAHVKTLEETGKTLSNEISKTQEELKLVQQELNDAKERETVVISAPPSNKLGKSLKNLIVQAFEVLLPRIQLQEEDWQCLMKEIIKPNSTLRHLKDLNENSKISKAKSFSNHENVFEIEDVQVGIPGKAAMGRIYYKHEDGKLDVGIHIKKDKAQQNRFVENRFG